jgi:phosphoglycerol transferase MdoB-like AlkP superfamily enzyme
MKKVSLALTVGMLFLPLAALAQYGGGVPQLQAVDVMEVLNNIVNWLFAILLVVAVIYLILAGYFFVTSQGEPDKMSKARNMVLYALIGVLVAFVSKGLIELVRRIVMGS